MKKLSILIFLIVLFVGCTARYEVVQKLRVNMYHLQNVKTNEIEIILSEKELKEGDIIKLWQLPEVEFEGDHYRKLK